MRRTESTSALIKELTQHANGATKDEVGLDPNKYRVSPAPSLRMKLWNNISERLWTISPRKRVVLDLKLRTSQLARAISEKARLNIIMRMIDDIDALATQMEDFADPSDQAILTQIKAKNAAIKARMEALSARSHWHPRILSARSHRHARDTQPEHSVRSTAENTRSMMSALFDLPLSEYAHLSSRPEKQRKAMTKAVVQSRRLCINRTGTSGVILSDDVKKIDQTVVTVCANLDGKALVTYGANTTKTERMVMRALNLGVTNIKCKGNTDSPKLKKLLGLIKTCQYLESSDRKYHDDQQYHVPTQMKRQHQDGMNYLSTYRDIIYTLPVRQLRQLRYALGESGGVASDDALRDMFPEQDLSALSGNTLVAHVREELAYLMEECLDLDNGLISHLPERAAAHADDELRVMPAASGAAADYPPEHAHPENIARGAAHARVIGGRPLVVSPDVGDAERPGLGGSGSGSGGE